jgi:hypothetical protein
MPALLPVFVLLLALHPVESTVQLLSASGTQVAVHVTRSRVGANAAVVFDWIPTSNPGQSIQVSVAIRPDLARRGGIQAHVTIATKVSDGAAMAPTRSGSSGYDAVFQEGRPSAFPIPMARYAGAPMTVVITARTLR